MATLKAWLFVDRVRSIATFFAILIGVGLLGWQALAPRTVKLEPESFNVIKSATDEIRRVANSSEQIVKDNEEFKATIKEQMQTQANLRKANYDLLFKEFGIGPMPDNYALGSTLPDGLQQQSFGEGGSAIHPDAGGSDNVQRLRDTAGHYPETTDGSTPGVSGGSSSPPSEQSGRSDHMAGKKQLSPP